MCFYLHGHLFVTFEQKAQIVLFAWTLNGVIGLIVRSPSRRGLLHAARFTTLQVFEMKLWIYCVLFLNLRSKMLTVISIPDVK